MLDTVLAYLLDNPDGVTSVSLAQAILKFKNPSEKLAHTAISAMLKNDARFFLDEKGLWHVDARKLTSKATGLQDLPWVTVGVYYHEQTVLHVSVWRATPAPECLFNCWFKDPAMLPYEEQLVLVSPTDELFDETQLSKNIQTLSALLRKNTPVFLSAAEMDAVTGLCAARNAYYDDASAWSIRTLARVAGVTLPRPLTLPDLYQTLFATSGESTYAYRRGALLAECCRELLARSAAGGIGSLEALEQEVSKGVDRSYFEGKRFTYEEICALPQSFGVYGFKNKDAEFIYIGKSRNLQKRLQSYFNDTEESPRKIERIRKEAHTLTTYPCGSELECLIYEYRLIRKHKPVLNTQQSISERKGEFAPLPDSIILLPHADPGQGMSFWFRANQKIILKPFAVSFPAQTTLIKELEEFFFSKKLPTQLTDFAEYEIAFRWIKSNYDTLVLIEVGRYATAGEVYRAMASYWSEVPGAAEAM